MNEKVLLVLNGIFNHKKEEYKKIVDTYHKIIAVDGGYEFLKKITNREPNTIIGDFDSIDKNKIKNFSGEIHEFSSDKDKTDGELAIDYCIDNNYLNIGIIGASGGRIDQQLGNIFLLEYALKNNLKACILEPGIEIGIIDNNKVIKNKKDYILSLFSLSDNVYIKRLKGCKYELKDYNLNRASSRGISNIINKNIVNIEINTGKLLYFTCKKC